MKVIERFQERVLSLKVVLVANPTARRGTPDSEVELVLPPLR